MIRNSTKILNFSVQQREPLQPGLYGTSQGHQCFLLRALPEDVPHGSRYFRAFVETPCKGLRILTEVEVAPLPRTRREHSLPGRLEPLVRIAHDQLHAAEASTDQIRQEHSPVDFPRSRIPAFRALRVSLPY